MAKPKTKTKPQEDLESGLAFHEREWRVQRIGWAFIALVPLLALAGLFGSGPLSEVRVRDAAAGTLQYERFVRRGTETILRIEPLAAGSSEASVRVALATGYLEAFKVQHVTPEPASTRLEEGHIVYEFEQAGGGAAITFHLQPERIGSHSTQLVLGSGRRVALRQFTYP